METNELRLKLHTKISSVRNDVAYVQKNGKNNFHGYKYATEGDVLSHIREALETHKLSITPCTNGEPLKMERPTKNGTTVVTTIPMKFIIVDLETGYSEEREWLGEGEDQADKGLYKAYTGGVKYFFLKTFLVETGDDPENDNDKTKDNNGNGKNKEGAKDTTKGEDSKIDAEEARKKIDSLPSNIKDRFRALGYNANVVYTFCKERNWNNQAILKQINIIVDSQNASRS